MSRDRESVRTREWITLSSECLDKVHGDCTNESCTCHCHHEAESDEDDQDESP
jgi:hypothetical protein